MREIKFRAKSRNYENEWFYGGIWYSNETWHIIEEGDFFPEWVHGETIGQYTGLKDCNGVEIYEGDIIEELSSYGYPIRHVVGWSDKGAHFTATLLPIEEYVNLVCGIFQEWVSSKSVVGNIHDHPEPLKGGEE